MATGVKFFHHQIFATKNLFYVWIGVAKGYTFKQTSAASVIVQTKQKQGVNCLHRCHLLSDWSRAAEIFLRLASVVAVGGCGLIDFQWPKPLVVQFAPMPNRLNPHLITWETVFGSCGVYKRWEIGAGIRRVQSKCSLARPGFQATLIAVNINWGELKGQVRRVSLICMHRRSHCLRFYWVLRDATPMCLRRCQK